MARKTHIARTIHPYQAIQTETKLYKVIIYCKKNTHGIIGVEQSIPINTKIIRETQLYKVTQKIKMNL